MAYQIQQLNSQLVYIRWLKTPDTQTSQRFLEELTSLVESASDGVYFMSDLRQGRIIDIKQLQQLGILSQHANWLGSVAFSENPLSNVFANTYHRMLTNNKERNLIVKEADKALAFLETLQEGITEGIEWKVVFA